MWPRCSRVASHRRLGGLLWATGLLLVQTVFAGPPAGGAPHGGPLANSIDLRPALDKWGLGPRIQGKRGTCSVFAVTGALEYAVARKTDHATRLSVEFLNWASNQAIRDTHDGGFFSDLWRGTHLLLAHALPPDRPHRGNQRQSRPLDRPILAGGLGAVG